MARMATVRGTPAEWDHFYKTGVATPASDAAASAPIAPQKEPPAAGNTRQTVEVVLSEKEAANWAAFALCGLVIHMSRPEAWPMWVLV